jgi:hypothetical protein
MLLRSAAALIGVIDVLKPDDVGVWAEARLESRSRYVGELRQLIVQGTLGRSSGSLPHLVVKNARAGEIRRWIVIKGSLTPNPAQPICPHEQKATYAEVAQLA